MYDDAGDPENAFARYEQTVALDPDHAPAWNSMGLLHSDDESWDDAIASFRKALKIDPTYPNAHVNLAEAYLEHPDFPVADAEEEFNRALEFDAENPDALAGLGAILYDDGKYSRALKYFEQAARVDPDSAPAHFALGNTYWALDDWREAITAWRRAGTLDPDFADPHYWLAHALLRRDDALEAAIHFRIYLGLDPEGEWAEQAGQQLKKLSADWPL